MENCNGAPVLVYDSGIGGLPYLAALRSQFPDQAFVYFADSRNFPFGSQTGSALLTVLVSLLPPLVLRLRAKLLLLACNTASVVALEKLRSLLEIPVVATVPAVKPAAIRSKKKQIAILATAQTTQTEYLDQLIIRHAPDCRISKIAAGSLVRFIEENLHKGQQRELLQQLRPFAARIKESGADQVVLGCTHFLHIVTNLQDLLGDNVEIVDSLGGVVAQTASKITQQDPGSSTLLLSGSSSAKWQFWADKYSLQLL